MIIKKITLSLIFIFLFTSYCVSETDTTKFVKLLNNYPFNSDFNQKRDFLREIYDSLKLNGNTQDTYYFLKTANNFFKTKNDVITESATINYLGLFYNNIGKYNDAINTFSKGINLLENYKLKKQNSDEVHSVLYLLYLNYGNTFYFLDEPNKALAYYKKAFIEIKNKKTFDRSDSLKMAQVFNNFGITYSQKNDNETGIYYFKKALKMNEQLKDTSRIANVLSNLASLHSSNHEIDSALSKYFLVKSIYGREKNKTDIAFVNGQIASVYLNNGSPKAGLPYALVALANCDTNTFSHELVETYNVLNNIYGELKDYKNEIKYLKLFIAVSDSINKEETLNEINRKEMLLNFNAMHVTDSVKSAEELKRKDLNIQSNRRQSFFLVIVLILAFVAIGLIYSRFKLAKKQNAIIEAQKKIVDEKNIEITDSIKYAKRIQNSLLPTHKYIDKNLKRLKNE